MCRQAVKVKSPDGLPSRYRAPVMKRSALMRLFAVSLHGFILIRFVPRGVVTTRQVVHTHNRRDAMSQKA
jgi:hypothetical protein